MDIFLKMKNNKKELFNMSFYFKNVATLEELKKEYKRLVKLHHPDIGGKTETMQEINAEYDKLFDILKDKKNADPETKHKVTETPEMFRNIIEKIIHMEGIEIEICGTWIWLSGDTKTYKNELKQCEFMWAKTKMMWYWRSEEYKSFGHKSKPMEYIRSKYGSDKIEKHINKKLSHA